jgi:putative transposase
LSLSQTTVRKTFKEKLRPRKSGRWTQWCGGRRDLYNAASVQRISAYQRRHVSVSRFEQEAELKELRAAFPNYEAVHSHVLQDVLARLDKTYQAFFRRLQREEKAGFPRFHSFTFNEYGNGARLENGYLLLSKIGRVCVQWTRPLQGMPKTVTISKETDAGTWPPPALTCQYSPCP